MKITSNYQPRPIRFVEVFEEQNISFKFYSISNRNEVAAQENKKAVKQKALAWHQEMETQGLNTYRTAILMVHEVKEGLMGICSRWIDENMLQTHVYLQDLNQPEIFHPFSQNGINTCVWELAVLWHERNAWVKYILMQNEKPDMEAYLNEQLNTTL